MSIVERIKNICLTPNTEWPVIAGEMTTTGALLSGYAVPLAAIGAVAGFVGGTVVGRTLPFIGGTYRVPILDGLVLAVFTFVMAIVGVFILSLIINALAPSFGGEKNSTQALKLAVYSYTPAWVAGALQILPALGLLAILGGLYGLYLLYLGLPRLMKNPEDKTVGYAVVVIVCAIVVSIVVGSLGGLMVAGPAMLGGGLMGGGRAPSEVQFDKDSPLGKLQEIGKAVEESGKKMEAAEKSGDQSAQVAAAMEGLGALLGGGKRVDPLDIELLKPIVPATFAGLPRTSSKAEKSGIASLMISKAEATYSDGGGKRATLDVSDAGGVGGLMGLASWAGVQGEQEDDNSVERTRRVDGRLVHEKRSKRGGTNEFAVVLADRFVVSATGTGIELDELTAAVSALDLGKLEAMKDVGVQKRD